MIRVRCKNQNCHAEGEGETFDEAARKVDHGIALYRDPLPGNNFRGCPGGNDLLEVITTDKKGNVQVVPKESLKPSKDDFKIKDTSKRNK